LEVPGDGTQFYPILCEFYARTINMKNWKRLLFYLSLNIFVSACTILAVLYTWDRMKGPLPKDLLPQRISFTNPATATLPVETEEPPTPGPTPTEEFFVYQVQAGDTFESIAESYNMSADELIAINGFTKSQPLGAGEVLRIPKHPKGSVVISNVIGVGDLETEHVLLEHRGEGDLSLVGWSLKDSEGNEFVFPQSPQLTLYSGGAVNIYTKAGTNTVVDLYWGLDRSVWSSGATVVLQDNQGNVWATYVIP
jgi:LysM repeat protein